MKKLVVIMFMVLVACQTDTATNDSKHNYIGIICIEGHTYYETIGGYKGGIAPKLTKEGRPVPCTIGDKK